MNTSSCSDSSSLIDGISSSAEAIFEANIKNSPQNSQRHSTPSKTGLRFIVADSEDDDLQTDLTSLSASSKCETTFSRTTFANNAGYPNCGTYFVQHISDTEECYATDNGNNLNSLDENDNTSSAYASPNSIRRLVHGAEQLALIQAPVDDSDVDYRPSSSLVALRPCKDKKTKRSHSFHESCLKDFLLSSEDEMDCERDSLNPSLKDASSLSQLVDSVVAEVQQGGLFSEDDEEVDVDKLLPKIVTTSVEEGEAAANEEEELSEFWDQEKYLSEHNYDEPIDVDRTLKLLNFGDDYSKFIDSMSDEFSDLEQNNQIVVASKQQPRTKRKVRRSAKGSRYDSMSDSEASDDAWKAVLLSRTKLNEVKQRLRNLEEDDQFINNSVELTILKDVCYENVDCILKLLDESGAENSTVIVLKKTERSFKGLLKQWQETLQMIVQRLQLSESFTKIMSEVKAFESSLQKATLPLESPDQLIHRKEDLESHIENLKTSIMSLTQNKSDLFHINVEVHNFLAELTCCPGVVFNTPPTSLGRKDHRQHHFRQPQLTSEANNHYTKILLPSTPGHGETPITKGLKEKVTALYSTWDEAFHKTNTQLVNAQTTYANLLQFEIESKRLGTIIEQPSSTMAQRVFRSSRKKQDSLSLTEDSGISESCDDSEEAILTKMKLLARDLEQKLSLDSNLVQEIAQTLKTSTSDLEERLLDFHHNQRRLQTSNDRNCTGTQTIEEMLDYYAEEKPKPRTTWFGRILRFFLPVQFFLMVMLFLAWHSTSDHHLGYYHHGCEASRFHFLYPQLKYINGPPPI